MPMAVGFAVIICASAGMAHAQSMQAQDVCAAQAEKAHQTYNNADNVAGFKLETDYYQSHYNTRLKKRLILITQTFDYYAKTYITVQLLDAFGRRVFANYSLVLGGSTEMYCELTPMLNETTNCSSRDESTRSLRSIWNNDRMEATRWGPSGAMLRAHILSP